MQKSEMIAKLLEASDAYYNKSNPIMTDGEYDKLFDEFKEKYPNDPFLKTIGSPIDPTSKWEKATHKIPMGSLNKVVNIDELRAWATKVGVEWFALSEKLDGISIDLEYEDSKLVRAITRGDGEIGEDITKNVRRMQNVHPFLHSNFTGSVRGEIIIAQDDFETVVALQKQRNEEPIKNLRNGASGLAKRYDGKYSEFLSIVYYDITGTYERKNEKFLDLMNLGLPTSAILMNDQLPRKFRVSDIETMYNEYEHSKRASLDYEIDGLVVEINELDKYEELGSKDGRPKGAVAFKFTSMKKETKIIGVEWSIGNSGHISPVAILEPVHLGGVTVRRASLHNLEMFKEMNLHENDTVLVSRRNDVIPYVEEIVSREIGQEPFGIPTRCPECGSDLQVDGKFLVCDESECPAAMVGTILKWLDATGMKSQGIGEKTIQRLHELGIVQYPADLYDLVPIEIAAIDGFGMSSAKKIVEIAESHKEVTLAQFIGGLNIKNFSTSMAELLIENGYSTLDSMINADVNDLIKIKGIEVKTATAFVTGMAIKEDIITDLLSNGVQIIEKISTSGNESKLNGKSFCFTGAMSRPRKELEKLVKDNGGEVRGVSKGLTYLVQADPSSTSGKTTKAKSLGTEIISEEQFMEMV